MRGNVRGFVKQYIVALISFVLGLLIGLIALLQYSLASVTIRDEILVLLWDRTTYLIVVLVLGGAIAYYVQSKQILNKIIYSKLHEKRIEKLEPLYSALGEMEYDLNAYLNYETKKNHIPNKQATFVKALDSSTEFGKLYLKARLFIPERMRKSAGIILMKNAGLVNHRSEDKVQDFQVLIREGQKLLKSIDQIVGSELDPDQL